MKVCLRNQYGRAGGCKMPMMLIYVKQATALILNNDHDDDLNYTNTR